jgi:hypothetical protein
MKETSVWRRVEKSLLKRGAFQVAVKSGYFSPPLAKRSDKRSEAREERGFDTWR